MSASEEFISWLNEQLRQLNMDEGVFGSYIVGILEGDETAEEKNEALEGILSETGVSSTGFHSGSTSDYIPFPCSLPTSMSWWPPYCKSGSRVIPAPMSRPRRAWTST